MISVRDWGWEVGFVIANKHPKKPPPSTLYIVDAILWNVCRSQISSFSEGGELFNWPLICNLGQGIEGQRSPPLSSSSSSSSLVSFEWWLVTEMQFSSANCTIRSLAALFLRMFRGVGGIGGRRWSLSIKWQPTIPVTDWTVWLGTLWTL